MSLATLSDGTHPALLCLYARHLAPGETTLDALGPQPCLAGLAATTSVLQANDAATALQLALLAHPGQGFEKFEALKSAPIALIAKDGQFTWWQWLKVRHGSADGISARMKLAGQAAVAATAFGLVLLDPAYRESLCEIWLPVLNGPIWSAHSWGWPFLACLAVAGAFFVLVAVGCSNAVNLTDGLDGLAIGCVLITTTVLGVVAYLAGHLEFANYLRISHVTGAGELAVFCAALAGGSLVFLWHNAAPAEIYMGDVGALGLGGALGAVACLMHQPFLLAIVGGVFVVEAVSVMLQVAYFKRTGGKRLFLMTPIHHHFQKKGWPATKVVARFWILSLLCGLLGLLSLKLR